MGHLSEYDVSRVSATLWVGGGERTPDLLGERLRALVGQAGVTHCICADAALDDEALGVPSSVHFLHLAWADDASGKPLADLLRVLAFARGALTGATMPAGQFAKLPVFYVHSTHGVARAPAVATFLLAALSGLEAREAAALVERARPVAKGYAIAGLRAMVDAALAQVRPTGLREQTRRSA